MGARTKSSGSSWGCSEGPAITPGRALVRPPAVPHTGRARTHGPHDPASAQRDSELARGISENHVCRNATGGRRP